MNFVIRVLGTRIRELACGGTVLRDELADA
jgi:hypothetical protein